MKTKNELLYALEHCIEPRPSKNGIRCDNCLYACTPDGNQTLVCRDLLQDMKEYIMSSNMHETTFGIPASHIKTTMAHFGDRDTQLSVVHEEMGELIQALSKYKRAVKDKDFNKAKRARNNIVEETVHVAIVCGILAKMFDITQEETDAELKKARDKMAEKRSGLSVSATYSIVWDLPVGANAIGSYTNVTIREACKLPLSERKTIRWNGALVKSIEHNICCGESKTKIAICFDGKTYHFETTPYSTSEYFLASIEASL